MKKVVVIGAGPAGLRAAYAVKSLGYEVCLVERNNYSGGIVNLLDKQFPTDSCGLCRIIPNAGCDESEEYCLKRGAGNIELILGYEILKIAGDFPSFAVELLRKPPYVLAERCIGCGKCELVCPRGSSYFEFRSAIHRSTKISSLNEYTIDSTCDMCGECVRVCPTGAIVLDREDKKVVECNSVLIASGLSEVLPYERCASYGYGRYKNVVTSLELERILSFNEGKIVLPSGSKHVSRVCFIQCVCSRDEANPYCSSACCMFTLKEIRMIKEKNPDIECQVFFMDMRAFGKGYWKYFKQTGGAQFIRCRVASVEEVDGGKLLVKYETDDGKFSESTFDLVVLAVGLVQSKNFIEFARSSGLEIDDYGYIKRKDVLRFETTKEGIFVAGNVVEPKDISDGITDALAASAELVAKLGEPENKMEIQLPDDVSGTIVYLCDCNGEIEKRIDFTRLEENLRRFANVISVERTGKLCNPEGLEFISEALKGKQPEFVLIGACQGYYFSSLFKKAIEKALGYSVRLKIVDLKTLPVGTEAALKMMSANLRVLASSKSEAISLKNETDEVLVVGGGVAGLSAALVLAEAGIPVSVVEREAMLGGKILQRGGVYEKFQISHLVSEAISRLRAFSNVSIFTETEIESIDGFLGNFWVKFKGGKRPRRFASVIVATGGNEHIPKISSVFPAKLVLNTEAERILSNPESIPERIGFVQCVECLDEFRPYCSRFCCRKSLELAAKILELKPDARITFFIREIMSYGASERLYKALREKGVLFIRYSLERPIYFVDGANLIDINGRLAEENPYRFGDSNSLRLVVYDELLGRHLLFELDLVVAAAGIDPSDFSTNMVKRDGCGFFVGHDPKFLPQETDIAGLIVVGAARMPMNFAEAVADGKAGAMLAMTYVKGMPYAYRGTKAFVSRRKCTNCLLCVAACPYGARYSEPESNIVVVNEMLCRGCGVCAVVCPSQATDMRGFSARALINAVDDLSS